MQTSKRFRAASNPLPAGVVQDLIVLHYTEGGSAAGAFAWWDTLYQQSNKKTPIGTRFVIDRDGTVYEGFGRDRWAWHLGINDRTQDSRAIGIELVGWGPLGKDPGTGRGFPWRQVGNVKTWIPAKEIEAAGGVWRKSTALHHAFTDAQYTSGAALVRQLCEQLHIPKRIPPKEKWLEEKPDLAWFRSWKGIAAHQHCSAMRLDIGPAWDWKRFEGMIL